MFGILLLCFHICDMEYLDPFGTTVSVIHSRRDMAESFQPDVIGFALYMHYHLMQRLESCLQRIKVRALLWTVSAASRTGFSKLSVTKLVLSLPVRTGNEGSGWYQIGNKSDHAHPLAQAACMPERLSKSRLDHYQDADSSSAKSEEFTQ